MSSDSKEDSAAANSIATVEGVKDSIKNSLEKVKTFMDSFAGTANEIAEGVKVAADELKDKVDAAEQEAKEIAAKSQEALNAIASSVELHENTAVEMLNSFREEVFKAIDVLSGVADFVSEAWEESEGGRPMAALEEDNKHENNKKKRE